MLAWDAPPRSTGGVAGHVGGLASAMAAAGHEVVVLAMHHHPIGGQSLPDDTGWSAGSLGGARVLRADTSLPWLPDDFPVATASSANHQLVQLVAQLGDWRADVVHTHDWRVAWAGDTLRTLWDVPMVATLHSTERGVHGGHVPQGTPAAINSVEWWLTYQARRVISCSRFMRHEVISGFELPPDKVDLVPEGIDQQLWSGLRSTEQPAADGDHPLIVAWGRVQYEKGFQVLVQAMAELRSRAPHARCVIAGRGGYLPDLQSIIDIEGLSDTVQLTGFLRQDELRELVARAACVVIPSLYEPFGIVALEGMAAGAPTIASRTGGLAEILDGSDAGLMFEPGNHSELADRIVEVLQHPARAAAMAAQATTLLNDRYSWQAIAASTVEVYQSAIDE
jgi:glycogen synthase